MTFTEKMSSLRFGLVFLLVFLAAPSVFSQGGKIVSEKIHSRSLEKNATGESSDRDVAIYLPPDYDASQAKRYPVVYFLHGIGDSHETWLDDGGGDWTHIKSVMDKSFVEGRIRPMIVVMPDERTKWFGSFYVSSAATVNWEDFTVKDLVNFVDGKYRTIAKPRPSQPNVGTRRQTLDRSYTLF